MRHFFAVAVCAMGLSGLGLTGCDSTASERGAEGPDLSDEAVERERIELDQVHTLPEGIVIYET